MPCPAFSKGAFSKSRSQLKPSAFGELNQVALRSFYSRAPYKTFEGFRLLAVDGSTLRLPKHPSVQERFGEHGFGPDAAAHQSLGRTSLLYDVCNLTILHGCMEGYATSEISLVEQHLPQAQSGKDLLVLDRGYANWNLMARLRALSIDFVIRVPNGWWHVVRDFVAGGSIEKQVEVAAQAGALPLRLVRVDLGDGTVEVLCTSLDASRLPAACFKELYHLRWQLEEGYKLLKARLRLEAFSGKTALAVEQDFGAAIFAVTMTAILCFPVAERLQKQTDQMAGARKHPRRINRTTALSKVKDHLIQLVLHKAIHPTLQALSICFEKITEIVRPDRTYKRNHKKKHPPNQYYKPL